MPCPLECRCQAIDMFDVDFTRLSYLMDCSNQFRTNDRLIYRAEDDSIKEGKIITDDSNESTVDYVISLDLSNATSIKQFTCETVQLTNFSFSIRTLALTNQPKSFHLHSNAFNAPIYQNLKLLNLSACCQNIPNDCSQLFQPLTQLEILDLSGSNLYKTCFATSGKTEPLAQNPSNDLSREDSPYPALVDLILRNNVYDEKTFANDTHSFFSVRTISGKLDLQNSRFDVVSDGGNCLFNIFQQITALDFSSIRFPTDQIDVYLANYLKCEFRSDGIRDGEQILHLYLRQLGLQHLPNWFTMDRFPLLRRLDLSSNNLYSIDIQTFTTLRYLSLANNPIPIEQIIWCADTIYESINLRQTVTNRTYDLSRRLRNLLKITSNIDYSTNPTINPSNLTSIPLDSDSFSKPLSLNISRTNIVSFTVIINDLSRLDISWNTLTELDLVGYTKLTSLDCSNQYLKRLKFDEQLNSLIELKSSNNSLETIENFSSLQCDYLKLIDLSNNSIRSIGHLFSSLTSTVLRHIYLQRNSIETIPSNIFHEKLISLYEINLAWNRIKTIEINAFQAPNLQILDLTGNPLINIDVTSIFIDSLRVFNLYPDSQQLTKRCLLFPSNDTLLSLYTSWYIRVGNDLNDLNPCLSQYTNETKVHWLFRKSKPFIKYDMIYVGTGLVIMAIVISGIYLSQKGYLKFFQRYKRLNEPHLIEMEEYPCEDDEIVMNLSQSPYKQLSRGPTDE